MQQIMRLVDFVCSFTTLILMIFLHLLFDIQGVAERTPTFLKVNDNGMVGVGWHRRWQQFGLIIQLSVDTMSWSGEHHGFVIEAFFKNNDSVTATQRAFRMRFGLYATNAVPDRKTILRWVSNVRASGSALPRNQAVVLGTLEHLKMCNESEHRQSNLRGVLLENTLLPWGFLIEL